MEAYEHQGMHLRYMTVHPDDYDPNRKYPLVIMLHGFGANMQDLAGLSPVISSTGYVYAFPNGPESVELAPGFVGYSWTHPDRRRDPEEDAKSREKLLGFFGEVMEQYGVEPGNAALGGFSQGGRMAYLCGLSRPDLFAGWWRWARQSSTRRRCWSCCRQSGRSRSSSATASTTRRSPWSRRG